MFIDFYFSFNFFLEELFFLGVVIFGLRGILSPLSLPSRAYKSSSNGGLVIFELLSVKAGC